MCDVPHVPVTAGARKCPPQAACDVDQTLCRRCVRNLLALPRISTVPQLNMGVSSLSPVWSLARRTTLLFDRAGTRWIISAVLPLAARPLADGVRRIRHDRGWIHQFDDGVVVEPRPRLRSYDIGRSRNEYLWGFLYEPKIGDTIVDVGAGLGAETIYFARRVGPGGRVFAIEAHPRIYAYLDRSIALNNFSQVKTYNLALSNKHEIVHIKDDLDDLLGNFLVGQESGIPVESITIDELAGLETINRIDFLKMNIEGAERLAVEGLVKTLPNIAIMCISCHDFKYRRTGDSFFETKEFVKSFLQKNGFVVVERESEHEEVADQVNAFNPELIEPHFARRLP